jgi:tRNA(fMet)-specific endonuclease VapC
MIGEFHSKLKTNPIEEADLLIAAISASKGELLITRNVKHFERVPGLKVERW